MQIDSANIKSEASSFHATPDDGRGLLLLEQIQVEHGPVRLLGGMFLRAVEAVQDRGITLSLASFEELLRANLSNADSWSPLVPTFDCRYGAIAPSTGFCILGRNSNGHVVCSQAARFYDLAERSLKDALEDLTFLYPAIDTRPPHTVRITAPSAPVIHGKIAYSGGTWCHPNYRGKAMASLLPRISRCYALTRWDTEFTISFVTEALVKAGVASAYGYTNVERSINVTNGGDTVYDGALVWMDRRELLSDAENFVSRREAEIDVDIALRSTKK